MWNYLSQTVISVIHFIYSVCPERFSTHIDPAGWDQRPIKIVFRTAIPAITIATVASHSVNDLNVMPDKKITQTGGPAL